MDNLIFAWRADPAQRSRRFAALLGGVGLAALASTGALADEFQIGDIDFTMSGVATMGTAVRTAPQNPALIFAPNGKKAGVPATAISGSNLDDGNQMPGLNA